MKNGFGNLIMDINIVDNEVLINIQYTFKFLYQR